MVLKMKEHYKKKRHKGKTKQQAIIDIERITSMEELSWRQKLNTPRVREDGMHTKLFHQVANLNKRNNSIQMLFVYGLVSYDQTQIWNHSVKHYEHQSSGQFAWRPKLRGIAFESIEEEVATRHERPSEKMAWSIENTFGEKISVRDFIFIFLQFLFFYKEPNAND